MCDAMIRFPRRRRGLPLQSSEMLMKTRILIVDDLPENREILTGLLEPEGHDLETANDGQEARGARPRRPARPHPDGRDDAAPDRVRGLPAPQGRPAHRSSCPIVLVTGLLAREDRIQGIAAGCDDFLTKPVDSEQLIARTRTPAAHQGADRRARAGGERPRQPGHRARRQGQLHERPLRSASASYAEELGARAGPRPRGSGATCAARGCCTTSARSAPTSPT